ncbi:ThiF family adenylyltransferase [Paenibacillus humicola]|uniref:ThiF family adenylyltransferase n=1 Tax=Paenibacillus humicola TaxID=3110540 RepID=UPI00237AA656|nr:ThiF family adenylyltransferase [Paenibacillus humicola]
MTNQNGEKLASSADRYARQRRFAPIGDDGQRRIGESRAAVVGMGALGSVAAQHLVRSGVGFVRLIDRDVLEWSNLQRQVLYTESDVKRLLPKAVAAAERLGEINSQVTVEPVVADLTAVNAEELLDGVDIILDGSDNFTVRYLINDVAVKNGIPWMYGGVVGATGMTMPIVPGDTPCFRCLFPDVPEAGAVDTCETAGVLSPAVDVIASLQSAEALKWLSGNRDALSRSLLQIDLWHQHFMPLAVSASKKDDCPACGRRRFDFLEEAGYEPAAVALCGRNTIQISPARPVQIRLQELAGRLAAAGEVERNPFLVRFRRGDGLTAVLFPDGRTLIQGTEDLAAAKRIYSEIYGL